MKPSKSGSLVKSSQLSPLDSLAPSIPDYELIKRIGRGSYGEVWLARTKTGSYRAVKVVHRASFDDDKPYEREFTGIKEFEPVSRTHQAQVDILHVGRNDEAGCFYYVMELADDASAKTGEGQIQSALHHPALEAWKDDTHGSTAGSSIPRPIHPESYEPKTLQSELRRHGRLPSKQCLEIAISLAEALVHLHSHSLVHRDIKPSNIIFVNGRPKLADIGLVARADATLSFVGTEGFLPPEGPGKPQADIYSLGKVLYEMAVGKDRKHFPEPPTLLNELPDREAFQELNEIILKACANDARDRYQTAGLMHADLLLCRAGKSLRRSRLLEKRLALLIKLSVAGIGLTALVIAGYFYQEKQTRAARQLARQNQLQVAQLQEMNGLRMMEEGNLMGSLPWFTEALDRAQGDVATERRHRLRLGTILQQCPHLLQIIREPGRVTGARFGPDGHRIVTTGVLTNNQQYISEWSCPDDKLIQRIDTKRQRSNVNALISLSPDGRRALAWSSRPDSLQADVYDLSTGARLGEPLAHEKSLTQAVFSPDGLKVLTASLDQTVKLWNPASGQCLLTLEHPSALIGAEFDSTGESILTGCRNGHAYLWDAQSGRVRTEMDLTPDRRKGGADRLEFSPDGQLAAIASGKSVQVWQVREGNVLMSVTMEDRIEDLRFSPDGELLLATDSSGKARVWMAATGNPVTPLLDKRVGYWNTSRFSPDGSRIISGGGDLVTTIWDPRTGANLLPPLPANSPLAWFRNGVEVSLDGRRALTVSQFVQVWDLTGGDLASSAGSHGGGVNGIAFSPNGQWCVTASDDQTAQVWDSRTGLPVCPALRHEGRVGQARFTTDGQRVLTASDDGTARLWNAKTGEPVIPPLRHGAPIRNAEFSRDARWIFTVGQDKLVRLWNSATGLPVGQTIDHGTPYNLVGRFSPDSSRVITASASSLKAWQVPSGEPIDWAPPFFHTSYWQIDFSPDGRKVLLCMGDGAGAQVFDATTFDPITPKLSHNDKIVSQGAWSPDSTMVVTTGGDSAARIWDATTGRQLAPAMPHPQPGIWPSFSSDGRLLLTISASGNGVERDAAYVWDVNTGLLAVPPLKHGTPIWPAVFSPDGQRILTGGKNGTLRSWALSPYAGSVEDLKAIAQALSGRKMAGTTIVEPVDATEMKATFDDIRRKRPEFFLSSTNDWISFHRREAENQTRAGREFSARWHANQLKALVGDTPDFREWRDVIGN